jgi:enoyl-CoA hydratase/carnithine racemase
MSVPNLELKKENSVYILTMTNGEKANTFTADVLAEYHEVLDEVERGDENAALILTSNHDKFWNNGIDLEWLITQPSSYHQEFAGLLDAFYLRWAFLDLPTVGCLTGHTYAAGAILASALDFRFMRNDKGWFCFPEIDIRIPFTAVMHGIVSLLPNRLALRHLMLTGMKVGGEEAEEWQIVDAAYPPDTLFGKAMEHAEMLAKKDRKTYASIKKGMRRELAAMKGPV